MYLVLVAKQSPSSRFMLGSSQMTIAHSAVSFPSIINIGGTASCHPTNTVPDYSVPSSHFFAPSKAFPDKIQYPQLPLGSCGYWQPSRFEKYHFHSHPQLCQTAVAFGATCRCSIGVECWLLQTVYPRSSSQFEGSLLSCQYIAFLQAILENLL